MTTEALDGRRMQALADAAPLVRVALAKVLAPPEVASVVDALPADFRTFTASSVPGDARFDDGVDVHRCGVRRLFDSEGAGAFTKQMCRIDVVTTAANGLLLERAGALGTGAERCDFRFRRA